MRDVRGHENVQNVLNRSFHVAPIGNSIYKTVEVRRKEVDTYFLSSVCLPYLIYYGKDIQRHRFPVVKVVSLDSMVDITVVINGFIDVYVVGISISRMVANDMPIHLEKVRVGMDFLLESLASSNEKVENIHALRLYLDFYGTIEEIIFHANGLASIRMGSVIVSAEDFDDTSLLQAGLHYDRI